MTAGRAPRGALAAFLPSGVVAASLLALLAGCGGGSSSDSGTTATGAAAPLHDATPYSGLGNAALASAAEAAAVTSHTVVVGGSSIAYTATAGHLVASAPATGAAEASMFYVAYTVPALAGPARPIVYFYNGGPGSATVWLHLGAFAPRRVVTDDPSLDVPQPFALVDNAESLIDVADLVFVDAVGTGYSEAIAPAANRSYWSVDGDAALMRDFIARYAAVNARQASPTFLYGESYGTTRSAVLAPLMIAASMRLDGVVLQSSILDYNASCDVFAASDALSCAGSLPSYGMIGAWFGLASPAPANADAYAAQLRDFTTASYAPAVAAFIASGTAPSPSLLDQLAGLTGEPLAQWTADLDLDAFTFRRTLVPGKLLGRYDARVAAPLGSAAANGGDPSTQVIQAAFVAAAASLFSNELHYEATATYTMLSPALNVWDFSHDGRALPDTVPDLAAAMATAPALRVLSLAGYHDLATPFHQTELDLSRLGSPAGLAGRLYPGGHMIYLDDVSRPRLKADIAAFIAGAPMAADASVDGDVGPRSAEKRAGRRPTMRRLPSASSDAMREADAGSPVQGGDPALPAPLARAPRTVSPTGAAMRSIVERKLAELRRDPYR